MAGFPVKTKSRTKIIQFPVGRRDLIFGQFCGVALSGKFEFNGGLSLVSGLPAYAEHGADAVEETSRAGRGDGLHPAFRHQALYLCVLLIADGQLLHDGVIAVRPAVVPDHGCGDAPALTRRAVPADLGKGGYAVFTAEVMIVRRQDLTAPDSAVSPVAGAVKRDSDDRFAAVIFRHTGQDMRIVVLDAKEGDLPLLSDLLGDRSRVVFGMKVADYCLRGNFQESFHPSDGLLESAHGTEILQVAHIGGQVKEITRGDAEGIFEFSSDSQDTVDLCEGVGRFVRLGGTLLSLPLFFS